MFARFAASRAKLFAQNIYLSTSIAQSGHMIAQNAHPIQFCGFTFSATKYPFAFMRCSLKEITFFGHASAHRPQPLQTFSSIVIFAIVFPPPAPPLCGRRIMLPFIIYHHATKIKRFSTPKRKKLRKAARKNRKIM